MPPLAGLPRLLRSEPVLAELLAGADALVAAPEPARAFLLAGLATFATNSAILVVTPTSVDAEHLVHDLSAFVADREVELFPAWETLPFERVSPAVETMGDRLRVVARLAAPGDGARPIVVAPVKALLQRLATTGDAAAPVVVRRGQEISLDELIARLVGAGYRREYQVEHRGELAVRGGILDVYPSTADAPVRIDCFGDEVDRLSSFDLVDQRSTADLEVVEIFGCREMTPTPEVRALAARLAGSASFGRGELTRIAEGEIFDGMESFLPWLVPNDTLLPDLLGPSDRVVLVDPRRMRDRAVELLDEEVAIAESLAVTWGVAPGSEERGFPRLHLEFERLLDRTPARLANLLGAADGPDTLALRATGWPASLGDAAVISRRVGALARGGSSVVVCADSAASAQRLALLFDAEGVDVERLDGPAGDAGPDGAAERLARPGVHVVIAPLERGFVIESSGVACLAEPDLTGRRRPHRMPRARQRAVEGFFDDLEIGSYVVHQVHGVARYGGMVTRAIGGSERDYLLLEYRGADKLYVPSDQIDTLTPYSGGDSPSVSRLGGGDWQRQHARVRQAVREIAQELVVLYQRRLASPGHAFGPDSPWQLELEQSFPFTETTDQLKAIADVKGDMERSAPMDRLVCGDVGFGKTEVALRAVFKAVQENKQAAVLVPTTLLAQQHFATFSERFAPYPVRVEMLSRFLTNKEAREVVAGLRSGAVDVVIGTHRLLAADVEFADLGLLVIDEEQRFGVDHKEAVKKLSVDVDVLTLTASPIPRTLEMGLTGIRDLSVIDTPPAARIPILTYVGEQDERATAEAIRRELLREGQVFFVHNRVQDIERVANSLRELVPEARIAVAHGQMDEGTLEKVILDFADGAFDVLVCTTIIESGIDMPTVNTLVVDRADLLGLGQLHQLRGRVGRAGQRAYAYLFHPRDRVLSEQAYERLKTIGEYTELGSGFKIAMRDLEIRGAGNLLGNDQSGHIAAVGYDLYVRMVAEAVAELKGELPDAPAEIKLDLPVDAHLPKGYVEREDLRLEAYRRLAAVREEYEVDDIALEWTDRYGPLPIPAQALLSVARLRAECVRLELREVSVVRARPGGLSPGRQGEVIARLSPIKLRASERVRLQRLQPRAVYKDDQALLILPYVPGADPASTLANFVRELVPPDEAAAAGA